MTPPAEIGRKLHSEIDTWPYVLQATHGFKLMTGDEPDLENRRIAQARTVLVAQNLLEQLGISDSAPVVLMKGLEIAYLYPNVVERPFRDLDVLVRDPKTLWDTLVSAQYRPTPKHPLDIDHHHLPALEHPAGFLGVDLHHRPNVPGWVSIDPDLIFATAEPSRSGIPGILRPRDDLHALLIALHCWKSGFARLRDLYDALLLEAVSDRPVQDVASELGLARLWTATTQLAHALLLGEHNKATRTLDRVIDIRRLGRHGNKRTRLIAPYIVAGPVRVSRGHLRDYRIGNEARSSLTPDSR